MNPAQINAPGPRLDLVSGRPMVSSLRVAEHFEKNHRDVLKAIGNLVNEIVRERNFALTSGLNSEEMCPAEWAVTNFRETVTEVVMPTGGVRLDPAYLLTRDGFTILAMGFTGRKALAWKIRYIAAFNAMEAALARRREEAAALPELPPVERFMKDWMALWNRQVRAGMDLTLMQDLSDERKRAKAPAADQARYWSLVAAGQTPESLERLWRETDRALYPHGHPAPRAPRRRRRR